MITFGLLGPLPAWWFRRPQLWSELKSISLRELANPDKTHFQPLNYICVAY